MSSPEVKIILSLIDQTKEGLAQAGLNVKNYGQTVEEESKKIQVSWKDVATSVSGVITAGFSLYQMWDAVETRHVAVLRSTNMLEHAQRRQNNALEKLNETIAEHGAGSEEAAKAQEAYEAACKDVQVAQERLNLVQQNYNESLMRLVFVLPSVITLVDKAKASYAELKTVVDASQISVAGLGSVLGVLATTLAACYATSALFAPKMREFAETLDISTEAAAEARREVLGIDLSVKELGVTVDESGKGLTDYASKCDYVNEAFSQASQIHYSFAKALGISDEELASLCEQLGMTAEELEAFVVATGMTAEELKKLAEAAKTIPLTLEEELINKAQGIMERFKECMGEKSTATKEETEQAMKDMVDVTNELIAAGLLGEAQGLMDQFKEAEPDKMLEMSMNIDQIIEDMANNIDTKYEEMLAYADQFSGEERDMLIQRANEWREHEMAKLEQFKEWRAMFHIRMNADTQGFTDEEKNIIMTALNSILSESGQKWQDIEGDWQGVFTDILGDTSTFTSDQFTTIINALLTLKTESGMKWTEVTNEWKTALDDAEGHVATAIMNIQMKIDSLQGKDVYVNTYFTEYYRKVYEAAGAAAPESGTATISATAGTVGCFLSGTKISMLDGSKKSIENLNVGDLVKSWDSEKGIVNGTVTRTFRGKTEAYLIINGKLRVTPSHPFYVNGNLVEAGNLKIGDRLQNQNNSHVRVKEIHFIAEPAPVYNFEVNGEHNYFAEGVLVHNKPVTLTREGVLVLTQQEAVLWRMGFARRIMETVPKTTQVGRGERIINNFYIQADLRSDQDIRETARKLARYVAQEERRLGLD